MSYATDIADKLTETLTRFVTLNPHQLAGHAANLDFWLAEVRHAQEVIDGYNDRFEQMKDAQRRYASEKQTIHFATEDRDWHGPPETPGLPKGVPHSKLKESRTALVNAAYGLLLRCYKATFITEDQFRSFAASLGTSVDYQDL